MGRPRIPPGVNDNLMDYLLVLPLFLMVAYYIGAPILLYVSLKITANPTLQPAALNGLPPELLHYFIENSKRLTADGFESRGEYQLGSDDPNAQTILAALTHADTGDHAVIAAVILRFGEEWRPLTQHTEITTRFADGSRLCVSNRLEPDWFPPPRVKRCFRFAAAQDPRELYRLHRRAVACFVPDALPAEAPPQFDCAALILQEFREDCEAQRQAKMLFLDSQQGFYHATLRGAFLLTWQLLFPFRAARILRDYARDSTVRAKLLPPKREIG